jgi:UDP-N-acetylglucosamine 4-epimerase
MKSFEEILSSLRAKPKRWLVSGAAGFIGSNLVEALLREGQTVVALDNLATGHMHNLEQVESLVGPAAWRRLDFIMGDLRRREDCEKAVRGAEVILHQAALGSVPRSIEHPGASFEVNVLGTHNLLDAARLAGVRRFVYASSSSVYGDNPELPKVEDHLGRCLSPYAATKLANELFVDVFCRCYGLEGVGLRYFNVFGPRQDPNGAYAAVIPKWISSLLEGATVYINGDGETSRDFCPIANVVQANILAACQPVAAGTHSAYNIAVGGRTTLNQLFEQLRDSLKRMGVHLKPIVEFPKYRDFRVGDVQHSLADVSAASRSLGYSPTHDVSRGLDETIAWYVSQRHSAGEKI